MFTLRVGVSALACVIMLDLYGVDTYILVSLVLPIDVAHV